MNASKNTTPSTVLVLGAAGGIGSELCRRLAREGHQVALAGRTRETLEELAGELVELGASDVLVHQLDARSVDEVKRAVDAVTERFEKIDGMANCVGSILLKPAHLTSESEWNDVVSTNLGSAFAAVRAAAGAMRKTGGSVVLVSSAAARLGLANHEAIAAAKAGVTGLALSAAATYAGGGLRFNVVAPGLVRTPLTERIVGNPAAVKASEAMHALGRIGEPGDVARMIHWLLDPEQSWVTGQVFGIDGGLASVRTRTA